VLSLAAATANEPIDDPARRFAVATMRMLQRASEDETWARVMLRLVSRPGSGVDMSRYLREDLDTPEQAVRRGLCALGVDDTESARLAIEAATHSTSADRETAPNR
jgi:hypothetical protein